MAASTVLYCVDEDRIIEVIHKSKNKGEKAKMEIVV
jgi:hypothetical protein